MYGTDRDKWVFTPTPTTPNGWLECWTREMRMDVPNSKGEGKLLKINSIDIPSPQIDAKIQPDLLIESSHGKQFYVVFSLEKAFKPYDLPALIYPPDKGVNGAWWILPP